MVRNWIFWTIGEQTYFVNNPIISYRKIKVHRVETMDMGRSHWNNGVSGMILLEQWCQWKMHLWKLIWFLLYEIRYFGKISTNYDTFVNGVIC